MNTLMKSFISYLIASAVIALLSGCHNSQKCDCKGGHARPFGFDSMSESNVYKNSNGVGNSTLPPSTRK